VPISILPLGTANNTALALDVLSDVERAARGWHRGRPVPFDIGLVGDGFVRQRFAEAVGWGVFPSVIAKAEKMSSQKSVTKKLERDRRLFGSVARSALARDFRIELDGRDLSGRYLLVEVMNTPLLGPRLPLSPASDPADGVFELVLASAEHRAALEELASEGSMIHALPLRIERGARLRVETSETVMHCDGRLWRHPAGSRAYEVDVDPGAVFYLSEDGEECERKVSPSAARTHTRRAERGSECRSERFRVPRAPPSMATPVRAAVALTLGALAQSIPALAAPEPNPADGWTSSPAPAAAPATAPVPEAAPVVGAAESTPDAAPDAAPAEAPGMPAAPDSGPAQVPYRRPGPALPTPVSVGPSAPTPTSYDGPKLLFADRKPAIGVYAGVGTSYTHMLHRDGVVANAELALLIDHALAIGVGGAIFSRTPQGPDNIYGEPREYAASYGGLVLRYAVYAKDLPVYASLGVLLGGGAVALYQERYGSRADFDDDWDDDFEDGEHRHRADLKPFLVAQPELFVHANATRWLRFGVGGGYRFASAVRGYAFGAKDMGGVVLGGNVHLGWL
jgi:diacylglycerol kinase family enzyme